MSRYTQGMQTSFAPFDRKMKNILFVALAILLVATIVLSVVVIDTAVFKSNTDKQLAQRMMNCVSNAIDQVNKMSSVVNSGTASRLGVVRQYVYTMEQLNEISISLHGESGRLAPQEAFNALYGDIEAFETLTQTATSSTLDTRTLLLTHLTNLQLVLAQAQE